MSQNNHLNLTLITGASEGIGRSFAFEFAQQGHDLVLVARSEDKLQQVADEIVAEYGGRVYVYPMDLTRANAASLLYARLANEQLEIDILVNNAGVMYVEDFATASTEQLDRLLTLNIDALVRMTRQFLPDMLTREAGKIVNVASVASFIPTPKFAVYGASKAFVLSFTEALSEELKYSEVSAHCICPGFTKTNMLSEGKGMESVIPEFLKVSPEALVAGAYQAITKGETIYVDKIHNKALVQWSRLYPKWFVRGVSGFFSRF